MATVTGLTAERMQEIIDATIVDADVVGTHLILTKEDGSTIDAGVVGSTGGGITKVTAFPTVPPPTDGDMVVRTDQVGDPLYKFTDGVWELQPRMGAVTVPSVSVALTSNMTGLADQGVEAAIPFTSENWDTDNMHDNATNTTRITCKTPGNYIFTAKIYWLTSTAGQFREIGLKHYNAAGVQQNDAYQMSPPTSGGYAEESVTGIFKMAAGDYVVLVVNAATGGVTQINAGSGMSATWLGGAGQTVDERGSSAFLAHVGANVAAFGNAVLGANLNVEDLDTDDAFTPANGRYTVKSPGVYEFNASLNISGLVDQRRVIGYLYKNGAVNAVLCGGKQSGTSTLLLAGAAKAVAAAGDYFELFISITDDAGANQTATINATTTAFGGHMVSTGKTVTPMGIARNITHAAIATGNAVELALNVEDADNDGLIDFVGFGNRLSVRTAGTYVVTAQVNWAANANGLRLAYIEVLDSAGNAVANGVIGQDRRMAVTTAAHETQQSMSAVVELSVGQKLRVVGRQDSGGNLAPTFVRLAAVKSGSPVAPGGYAPVPPSRIAVAAIGWAAGFNDDTAAFVTKNAEGLVKFSGGAFRSIGAGAGAPGSLMFTLPVGFRPLERQEFAVMKWNSSVAANLPYIVRVNTDGTVTGGIINAALGNMAEQDRIMLANISFYAGQ